MTKLEQKLLELGYELHLDVIDDCICRIATKVCNKCDLVISIDNNSIECCYIYPFTRKIKSQQNIDNLQQAFNQLQKDLEVLNENENI